MPFFHGPLRSRRDRRSSIRGYGIVRHPMYMATVILFLSMPLVLGSPVSFIVMLGYIPVIVKRIRNEESVLTEGLDGYEAYKQKVRYRLFPFIW